MEEQAKLEEAKYFYEELKESYDNNYFNEFKFNLSAFLSSARSILQYTYKKSKKKNLLKEYDKLVANKEILSFFKDKRDLNIHKEPVNPKKQINVTIKTTISLSHKVTIKKFNKEGDLIETKESESNDKKNKKNESFSETSVKYVFDDWSGNEDIIELSKEYIKELELFIRSARNRGLL